MRYQLLKLLPKNLLSRFMGVLADAKLPSPLLLSVLKIYAKTYKIRLDEVKRPLEQMANFTEFFTRELKDGARPIHPERDAVVSPVDGTIAEFGEIKEGLLTQTKGVYYSLSDLVGEEMAAQWAQGYFLTIYLSPADYHRIHSPVPGKVSRFAYFSGQLWPVNKFGVSHVAGLFSVNERLVTPIESTGGLVGLIKVGATVVGKIKTRYTDLASNEGRGTAINLPVFPAMSFDKGEEIGQFQLGSTVILLFEKGRFTPLDLKPGKQLRMGQLIGRLEGL
ncbi:MAG: archaetidylserine decarboxylase [bacterium]|nr:archaetidylserine decarboxylase [bacterium]